MVDLKGKAVLEGWRCSREEVSLLYTLVKENSPIVDVFATCYLNWELCIYEVMNIYALVRL